MTTEERILLPTEPIRARFRVTHPDGTSQRLGRFEFLATADQSTVTAMRGDEIYTATVVGVDSLQPGRAWTIYTEGGDTWTVIAAGCNCGSA